MTTTAEILDAVHEATGCKPEEIVSKSRRHSVLFPRYIALSLLRRSRPFFSEMDLGQLLGIEGFGTARHALKRAAELMADPEFAAAFNRAKTILDQ